MQPLDAPKSTPPRCKHASWETRSARMCQSRVCSTQLPSPHTGGLSDAVTLKSSSAVRHRWRETRLSERRVRSSALYRQVRNVEHQR